MPSNTVVDEVDTVETTLKVDSPAESPATTVVVSDTSLETAHLPVDELPAVTVEVSATTLPESAT